MTELTALDATFLELEQIDDSAHMHIGSALLFEARPDGTIPSVEEIRADLAPRLKRLPRYTQRLSTPRTGELAWPAWEDYDTFDLAAHVRHATLSPPGGEAELLEWLGDFFSHRLDRSRPLWEAVLLDGLADGRWALCWKTHHCLVDGVGSVDVAEVLLDSEPRPGPPSATGSEVVAPRPGGVSSIVTPWIQLLPAPVRQATGAGLKAARSGLHGVLHPREALRRSAAVIELIVRDELLAAPPTSLNRPIGATRRMAVVRIPLKDLKEIKQALGGTVNDVVLTAATAGLRELLIERGEEPPARGLRAMVPLNVRTEEEHGALGNRVLSLFVELPVSAKDTLMRHHRVVAETTRQKQGSQRLGADTLLGITELAPPVLHSALARSLYATRLFNLVITNVPGSVRRLYALGAPMVGVIPLVPLAAEHAVGIAITSYDDEVTIGLVADHDSVSDLKVLATGMEQELDRLGRAARLASSTLERPKTREPAS